MAIILGIVGFIFLLIFVDQYLQNEEDKEKEKIETEYKRKLEIERLHKLKLEQDRIFLERYKSRLSSNGNLKDKSGLTKYQIILWCFLIIIITLLVSIAVWII